MKPRSTRPSAPLERDKLLRGEANSEVDRQGFEQSTAEAGETVEDVSGGDLLEGDGGQEVIKSEVDAVEIGVDCPSDGGHGSAIRVRVVAVVDSDSARGR